MIFDSWLHTGRIVVRGAAMLAVIFGVFCEPARAQNRVDLDDLTIKGELLNDNRLRISTREAHKITDRVSYRSNFRKEITDSLEIAWPAKTDSRGTASVDGDEDDGGAQ